MADLMAAPATVPVRDAADGPQVVAAEPRVDRHIWQIDVVRLLTFAAVIAVHCLAYTANPTDSFAAGLMMVLQFGREVFFALTGFVLVHSTLNRRVRTLHFWRKRFLFVGVPYLVWSCGYYAFSFVSGPHAPFSWHTFGVDLLDGNAEYHLYFLLVSMQLYLVFPLLARFVRRTKDHPWRVLLPVAVVNAAWFAAQQWLPWPSGWVSWFWVHDYELLPTYAIYVLLGCYAAVHRERLLDALRANRSRVVGWCAAGIALTVGAYAIQDQYMDPRLANQPLQPVMIIGSVSIVLLLVMIGDAWSNSRRPGLPAIKRGSDISFGVYLCHPLVLTLLCNAGLGNGLNSLPPGLATVFAFIGTATGAVIIGLALRRTPLALPLIGRARDRRSPDQPSLVASTTASIHHVARQIQPLFRSH